MTVYSGKSNMRVPPQAARGLGVGKLNHVAIAVPDLQQASTLYRDIMGAEVSEPAVRSSFLGCIYLLYFT